MIILDYDNTGTGCYSITSHISHHITCGPPAVQLEIRQLGADVHKLASHDTLSGKWVAVLGGH